MNPSTTPVKNKSPLGQHLSAVEKNLCPLREISFVKRENLFISYFS